MVSRGLQLQLPNLPYCCCLLGPPGRLAFSLAFYPDFLFLSLFCFRFILVFSCLVLSVFSTIPAHQDFSSYCLLILVRT